MLEKETEVLEQTGELQTKDKQEVKTNNNEVKKDSNDTLTQAEEIIEAEERRVAIEKLISSFDEKYKKIKAETPARKKIAKIFSVVFSNSNYTEQFFAENKKRLTSWLRQKETKIPTTEEFEKIMEEAQRDNFNGTLGGTRDNEGKLKIGYTPGENLQKAA